ncbi:unnamed protein product [Jaminaea pallidilutea]
MAPPASSSTPAPAYHFSTLCATVSDPEHADQYGSSSVPIYQSTTFKGLPGSEAKASEEFDYSRSGNPTRTVLQTHLSKVQNCKHSFAVSTGMACLDVITRPVRPGECIIAGDDIYGGTNRLLGLLSSSGGIDTHHIDTTNHQVLEETVRKVVEEQAKGGPRLGMVILETPTNPLLKIVDIKACVAAVRKHCAAEQVPIVLDNTMMSPVLMRPLEMGVDVVYDSATKYLSGHHDLMAGVIATNRDDLAKSYAFIINSVGNALAPFESFLLLRGLKTLSLRLHAQQTSSQIIAEHLDSLGFKTNYPGLKNHPGRDVHYSQARGAGAVISFETEDAELSQRIVGATRLWGVSVSFGCVNSLISMPCLMSHASIDPKVRAARRLPEDLIRLCVGIEEVEDLIGDLDSALLAAGAVERDSNGKLIRSRKGVAATASTSIAPSDTTTASQSAPAPIMVSAPGKVILFGEHAVVHGVTALAASVNLRCYALVQPRFDGKVHLELPELQVEHDWIVADLPWDALPSSIGGLDTQPHNDSQELDARLLRRIVQAVEVKATQEERSHASCVAFLYLYMTLSAKRKQGQTYTFRSLLPISAGLGSSASYSACLASALLYTNAWLPEVTGPSNALPADHTAMINKYAFLSERVLHGNPSGVDNSVAVYGGCLAFTRPNSPRNQLTQNRLDLLHGVKEKRLLLTDTGVPRDTKKLVAGVQEALNANPASVNAAFDAIQKISDEAAQLLTKGTGSSNDDDGELAALIERNHVLLQKLGVSHPSLEAIRTTLSALSPTLATKLTGAGGGGCALTLLPAGTSEALVSSALDSLRRLEVSSVHQTVVGGPGVSVLRDYETLQKSSVGREGETGELRREVEQERFRRATKEELGGWLEGQCGQGWARAE